MLQIKFKWLYRTHNGLQRYIDSRVLLEIIDIRIVSVGKMAKITIIGSRRNAKIVEIKEYVVNGSK